jgi:hypothetical protein
MKTSEKRKYERPRMQVVVLRHSEQLMQTSTQVPDYIIEEGQTW